MVETPLELHWGRYSRKDVQAGSSFVAICGTLFSSLGKGSPLQLQCGSTVYLWCFSSSLVVTCRLLSSFGMGRSSSLVVAGVSFLVVHLGSSLVVVKNSSNCDGCGSSLAVM